jgi:predicted nucleic acid-binding Zn ribbon protein
VAFKPVGSVLGRVLRNCRVTQKDVEALKIFSLWPEVVGESVARHARPVRVNNQRLFVEVDDPVWLAQLRLMRLDIVDRVEQMIGKDLIVDVALYLKGFSRGAGG